jgi:dCTP deaminase
MSVKSDRWIRDMALKNNMIDPFAEGCLNTEKMLLGRSGGVPQYANKRVISYGLSSYGYDIRLAPEFKIFSNLHSGIIDPKCFEGHFLYDILGDECIIPPNSFALARSIEYFRIPRSIIVICIGKSTYARVGLIANVTAFEPEWEGHVTIELSNTAPSPIKVYANEGIVQAIFLESDECCEISYKDKNGKYQGQTGITTAKVI